MKKYTSHTMLVAINPALNWTQRNYELLIWSLYNCLYILQYKKSAYQSEGKIVYMYFEYQYYKLSQPVLALYLTVKESVYHLDTLQKIWKNVIR